MKNSFVSVVNDKDDQTKVHVRARSRKCLESLFEGQSVKILTDAKADYVYRVVTDKVAFSNIIQSAIVGIDYPDFKSNIKNSKRHTFYSEVWRIMLRFKNSKDLPSKYLKDFRYSLY